MTTGSICSENGILNHICYEIGVADLIAQGYLSPLISKAGRGKADVSGLHLRGGEFIPGEAEALMDAEGLVRSAVAEIVEATRDRRACLIFCAGVKHGEHVARVFHEEHGIECGFLDGHTSSGERNRLVARFRGETAPADLFGESQAPLKYLANVNVLTTGFDAPHIDCVAMLRPTNSPGLYYQQIGRGFRLAPGKENCLVLDFADNIVRHGPVDLLRAGDRLGTKGDGSAPAKECPSCQTVVHASLMVCPQCGFEFPKREAPKHNAHASAAPVISTEIAEPLEFEVLETTYSLHRKRNAPENHPPSLCVNHRVGSYSECFAEYVCPEHTGYAREKFESWWRKRSTFPPPRTVKDAIRLANDGCLARTHGIRVQRDANGFDRICAWALGEKPVLDDDFLAGEREAQGEPVPATVEADPWGDEDDIPF